MIVMVESALRGKLETQERLNKPVGDRA